MVFFFEKVRLPTCRDKLSTAPPCFFEICCKGTTFFGRLLGKYAQKEDPPCPSLKGRELFSPFKGELERVLKGDFGYSPFKGEIEGVSLSV